MLRHDEDTYEVQRLGSAVTNICGVAADAELRMLAVSQLCLECGMNRNPDLRKDVVGLIASCILDQYTH